MIIPKASDAIHKAWLFRVLSAIADDVVLASELGFKGGTCGAMRGVLERFSVDLDFDWVQTGKINLAELRGKLEHLFQQLDLEIKDQSQRAPQYLLKYPNKPGQRSILRVEVTFPAPQSNDYEPVRFTEIDRILYCQTVPTMFANKLVAIIDRFQKHRSLAGRDLFDVHTFFIKGQQYKPQIIEERTGKSPRIFLKELKNFIDQKMTQSVIDEDLNHLLPLDSFKKTRKLFKQEVLMFLEDEIINLTHCEQNGF